MLNTMLDEYYTLRGWDGEGLPTLETLSKLDLKDISDQARKK
jgi:aldehyde:ferredoxin oxidoreductase